MSAKIGSLVLSVVVVCALFAGCVQGGPETVLVKGKITYKNKPVPNGTLNFFPDEGPSAYTEIKPDGSYELRAIRGKHKVVIVAMQDTASVLPEQRSALPPPIVLGHEGEGLSGTAIGACTHAARIAMANGVDSVNVATAAAIALYEICNGVGGHLQRTLTD